MAIGQNMESVQRKLTKLIDGVGLLHYKEILKKAKNFSLNCNYLTENAKYLKVRILQISLSGMNIVLNLVHDIC